MRRIPPVARRRHDRSVISVIARRPRRRAERTVTDLTRKGARVTLKDLRTITRVLNYSNESASIIGSLSTWQQGQINRYGFGIL